MSQQASAVCTDKSSCSLSRLFGSVKNFELGLVHKMFQDLGVVSDCFPNVEELRYSNLIVGYSFSKNKNCSQRTEEKFSEEEKQVLNCV